jgi:hypothetical protein
MSTGERLSWNTADPYEWTRQWPRCLLLFQLTQKYVRSGQAQACAKLSDRLEAWRPRMRGAPPLVDSLLAELWLTARLLLGGDLEEARHHAAQAEMKLARIEWLLLHTKCAEVCQKSAELRRRSVILHSRCRVLMDLSRQLITRSSATHRPGPSAEPLLPSFSMIE